MKIIRDYSLEFRAKNEGKDNYIFIEDIYSDVLKYVKKDSWEKAKIMYSIRILFDNSENQSYSTYNIDFIPEINDIYGGGVIWNALKEKGKTDEEIWGFICEGYSEILKAPVCLILDDDDFKELEL